jgi:DNA-nicking Smr family endonuclease
MNRRGKVVTADEEALFRSALRDAKPIRKRERAATELPKRGSVRVPHPHFPTQPNYNEQPAPPIGGHADAHLRRGRLEPDARLDLHGLTQDAAYRTLIGFLVRSQAQAFKLVLVITGKGGILRGVLPLWLGQAELRPLVAGLREAHMRHGGSGAFYILLRAPKRPGARGK